MSRPAYDVLLGEATDLKGYKLRSITKDSAPEVAPRFSTGQQGESDLDLLKNKTFTFESGMFQRMAEDDTLNARIVGMYNSYDGRLYPNPRYVIGTLPVTSGNTYASHAYTAKATAHNRSFSAAKVGSSENEILQFIGTGITELTLPNAVKLDGCQITGLVVHKGYLFIAGQIAGDTFNAHRYDISAATYQDIGGNVVCWGVLRGQLYAINKNSNLYTVTNETAAGSATYTLIRIVGPDDGTYDIPKGMIEFNGALWIWKPSGLYRFDGIDYVKILKDNINYVTEYNGALYYENAGWLYRFNGTVVEKLQYFGYGETIVDIEATRENLAILCRVDSSYADYVGVDSSVTTKPRVYYYNGVGFFVAYEETTSDEPRYGGMLVTSDEWLNIMFLSDGTYAAACKQIRGTNRFTQTSAYPNLEIVTSEFDGGFPNVFKSVEYVELNGERLANDDTVTIQQRTYNGSAWSSWVTIGTLSASSTTNRIEVVASGSITKLFKKIKIRAVLSNNGFSYCDYKATSLSIKYTLQPQVRWRWQVGLVAFGYNLYSPYTDNTGTVVTDEANQLTNQITQAIKCKTPLYFTSPDYARVKTQATNSATSIVIKGQLPLYTDPYAEYPLVAIKNSNGVWEVLEVLTVTYSSGSAQTTITVRQRGYLGITAAQINVDAEVRLLYRVYVTRLLRDNVILNDNTVNEDTTSESQLEREYLIEVIEV